MKTAKDELRIVLASRLRGLAPDVRASQSYRLVERLNRMPEWIQARTVALFVPVGIEVDVGGAIHAALTHGKCVALPWYDAHAKCYRMKRVQNMAFDLMPGPFGIPEPKADLAEILIPTLDFIVVPGLGFDLQGRRIGRGKGHYDRMLAEARGLTCGVGFDEQLVAEVPVEDHDMKMNWVLTALQSVCCDPPVERTKCRI